MNWKSAWSYLPVDWNTNIGTVCNITQRTFFKNNLDGTKIKIKFSNLFSKQSLTLENVTIGKRDKTQTDIREIRKVTFQKSEKIVVEAGAEFYSDEIDLSVCFKEDLVLSIYIKESTDIYSVCSTWAARSWNTRYGLDGNYVNEQTFTETDSFDVYTALQYDPNRADNIFGVTEIKVYTGNDVKTVAMFGDSITHMSYYSDALLEKLYECYPGKITVINRGLGGNRLLRDYSHVLDVPGGGTIFGHAGVERFYHDVYGSDQPETVLVLIGINDFTHPYALKHEDEAVTMDEYQKGITEIIRIAHENGSKIMIGTLTPFRYGETEWFTPSEKLRTEANKWIREQKFSDGIMDFDLATRITEKPEYMFEDCHLGDGLHPNVLGGKKMTDVVPVEWFK